MMLLAGSVANAQPDSRPVAAPAPDGTGASSAPPVIDKRRLVGVLEVRVEGVPDEVKQSFQHSIEDQFDIKQYRLIGRALMKQKLIRSTKWTEGCVVGECLAEVRAQTGAELVLLAALTGAGTSFGYVVTLVRTDTGRVFQQVSDRCDVCTVSEAMGNATLATVGLLNNVPDKLPDEADEQGAAINVAVGKATRELAAHDQHTTRIGMVLTAVGLAALITGGVLYGLDSKSIAAPTVAGGGALAMGGVVVLAF